MCRTMRTDPEPSEADKQLRKDITDSVIETLYDQGLGQEPSEHEDTVSPADVKEDHLLVLKLQLRCW